jgi:hypothetical protein
VREGHFYCCRCSFRADSLVDPANALRLLRFIFTTSCRIKSDLFTTVFRLICHSNWLIRRIRAIRGAQPIKLSPIRRKSCNYACNKFVKAEHAKLSHFGVVLTSWSFSCKHGAIFVAVCFWPQIRWRFVEKPSLSR